LKVTSSHALRISILTGRFTNGIFLKVGGSFSALTGYRRVPALDAAAAAAAAHIRNNIICAFIVWARWAGVGSGRQIHFFFPTLVHGVPSRGMPAPSAFLRVLGYLSVWLSESVSLCRCHGLHNRPRGRTAVHPMIVRVIRAQCRDCFQVRRRISPSPRLHNRPWGQTAAEAG
jgi:hypothetical protein